jgi:hypothetical protein
MAFAAFGNFSSSNWGDLIDEEIRADHGRSAPSQPPKSALPAVSRAELQLLEESSRDGINLMIKNVRY